MGDFVSPSGGLYPSQGWEANGLVVPWGHLTLPEHGKWPDEAPHHCERLANEEISCSLRSRVKTLMDPALGLCMCIEQCNSSFWSSLEVENLRSSELKGTNLLSNI